MGSAAAWAQQENTAFDCGVFSAQPAMHLLEPLPKYQRIRIFLIAWRPGPRFMPLCLKAMRINFENRAVCGGLWMQGVPPFKNKANTPRVCGGRFSNKELPSAL